LIRRGGTTTPGRDPAVTHSCISDLIRTWDETFGEKDKTERDLLGANFLRIVVLHSFLNLFPDRVTSEKMAEQDASPLRKFESSKMTLEWIVLVEDYPGKELERLEVRQWVLNSMTMLFVMRTMSIHNICSKHVEHVEPRLDPETGVYKMGGMDEFTSEIRKWTLTNEGIYLHETPKEGESMKIRGVASVIKADSAEEVLEEVKLDPYYTEGIWDPSTVSHLLWLQNCDNQVLMKRSSDQDFPRKLGFLN
jgi:uncharacterized protein YciI